MSYSLQIKLMARKDSRIKLVNEVLNGIKVQKHIMHMYQRLI